MVNYFEILNISINAEPEIIKASYKALAKKYHPDNYKGTREDADKKMVMINEAYRILSDETLKKQHIEQIKAFGSSEKTFSNSSNNQSPAQDFKKVYKEASIQYSERAAPHISHHSNITFSFSWLSAILIIAVIVSISFCIIHFGPNLLKEFLENTINQLEKLKYNWGL